MMGTTSVEGHSKRNFAIDHFIETNELSPAYCELSPLHVKPIPAVNWNRLVMTHEAKENITLHKKSR